MANVYIKLSEQYTLEFIIGSKYANIIKDGFEVGYVCKNEVNILSKKEALKLVLEFMRLN